MKEELWEILRDLEMGKISVNYANDRILRLFGVVGRSEQCCSPTDGFYLGTTCPHCNKPFRKDIR